MKRNSSKPKRRYGDAGFTLVELVVVIAVLAILAGVGAVAYSGYIEYTNKGVDRALVGEIMHAVELADYSDPTILGENGGATIYITAKGVLSDNEKLNVGLQDALGSLESLGLSYDKWGENGALDLSVIQNLKDKIGGIGTSLEAYWEATKDGGEASFSDDMNEYWEKVTELVNRLNADTTLGGQTHKNEYLSTLVDLSTGTQKDSIIDAWTKGTDFPSTGDNYMDRALLVARNFAFVSWAEDNWDSFELTQADIDAFNKYKEGNIYGMDFSKNGGVVGTGHKRNTWNDIVKQYWADSSTGEGQAKIDALAFAALMETAKQAEEGFADKTDAAYLEAIAPYASQAKTYMQTGGQARWNAAVDVVSKLGNTTAIAISVDKEDGTIVWNANSVTPQDANPRIG